MKLTHYVSLALGGLVLFLTLSLVLWGQQGHQKARSAAIETKAIATQLEASNAALRAAGEAAARDREISRKRIAALTTQAKKAEATNKELRRVLQDNPGWAAGRVPDGVRELLGPAAAAPATAPGTAGGLPSPGPEGRD